MTTEQLELEAMEHIVEVLRITHGAKPRQLTAAPSEDLWPYELNLDAAERTGY